MTETKKESFYDTLFRISQGDVELFKEETKVFLTAVAARTGAAAQLKRAAISPEPNYEAEAEPVLGGRTTQS